MKTLSSRRAFTFVGDATRRSYTFAQIRRGDPCPVENYQSLAQKIAEIQYDNPEFVLFFRGQQEDHRTTRENTSILPSIYRPRLNQRNLRRAKFKNLEKCAAKFMEIYHESKAQKDANRTRLSRSKILQWAILQHYEVCPTPLLDVTQSLRIASSFASHGNKTNQAFLMVLALPQIHGSVSACTASEIQIIRLASICPPHFTRPHIQEGFALTEYPDPVSHDTRAASEFDFGKRLIAKFSFHPQTFWKTSNPPFRPVIRSTWRMEAGRSRPRQSNPSFPPVAHSALYPPNDPFAEIKAAILRPNP